MRNHFLIFSILLLTTLFSSCSKSFLEQSNPNSVSVDDGYKTEVDIANGVYGAYQAMRSTNCIGENAQLWTDDRADDVNTTDNQSNSGEPFQFTAFSLVPGNSYLQRHWTALYAPISRANLILSLIGQVSFSSNDTKTQYIAELKFIRALMYFNLVREFGDIPLVTERLTSEQRATALTFRVPRAEVYQQIVADLKDVVASNLPVSQPAASKGKVSLQAANGLLGQVYLTMATSLEESKKTDNLGNAKNYLTDCYNKRGFTNLSDVPYREVFDVNKKSSNPEIIFQIAHLQGDANYSSSLARTNQAKGETINSKFVSQGTGGLFTKDLQNEFESGDLRTDFSVKYATANASYFITKFRDTSATAGVLGYGGNDWILMRYADIILNLAEVNMYQNNETAAIEYLNMVRARAHRPDYATMKTDPAYASKYPTLKLAILHERRVELAFEHHRWHDLTRFFNADQLVEYFHSKSQANYDNSPLSNFSAKDYYFPIPYNEYNLNPETMYQNPGYK